MQGKTQENQAAQAVHLKLQYVGSNAEKFQNAKKAVTHYTGTI